jgi:tRNA (guanine37-N1)-methyltransferase
MRFDVLTIFPDIIYKYCEDSILWRAQKNKKIQIRAIDFRDFADDKHNRVDDKMFGGGPGMLLKVGPIYRCLENLGVVKDGRKINNKKTKIILLDPAGKKFNQKMAEKFSKLDRIIFICGRYEGFDERVKKFVDEKISIGEYVLAGGELPALTILESTARLLPGVLGNLESLSSETFNRNLKNKKDFPQYTRPDNFLGLRVPKILLSGDHKKISKWRSKK